MINSKSSIRMHMTYGVIGTLGLKVSSVVAGLIANIILARRLGADEFGVYAFILAVIGLLAIPTSLGLPEFVVREVAKYRSKEQWGYIKGLLVRTHCAVAVVGVLLCVISAMVVALSEWGYKAAFYISLPLLLVNSLSNIRASILRGFRHVVLGQLPEAVIRPWLFTGILAVLALSGTILTPYRVLSVQLLCSIIVFSVGIWLLAKLLPRNVKSTKSQYSTDSMLSHAVPFLFLGAMTFVNSQVDILMLGFMRSNVEVGVYKVAAQGAQLVIFLLLSVNSTIGPLLSELHAAGDFSRLKSVANLSARIVLLGTLPVALVFIFFGRPIITSIFGSEYVNASVPLAILCFGQVVNAGMGSVALILNMTGNEKDSLKGMASASLLNIALNAMFIPKFGIIGAAWATSVSMMIWNLILAKMVYKRLGFWVHP